MPALRPRVLAAVLCGVLFSGCAPAPSAQDLPGFSTNTARRAIELRELRSGGPPKDGIPSIDRPRYVTAAAADWLADREPVVLLRVGAAARIYPLQILTWHEIANDTLGGRPVAVTFCPLCYSAIAVDREVRTPDGRQTLTFGVSGLLRHSDMVMFDRETETLWQQFTGEALVGDLLGTTLTLLPAQIVSFAQARADAPGALVLSRETDHRRDYGRNPYAGYDDVQQRPFLFDGPDNGRLPPLARVVAVQVGEGDAAVYRAYPADRTRTRRVIHDEIGGTAVVVLHTDGTATALDADRIADGRDVGATGVFRPRVPSPDGGARDLTFTFRDGAFVDAQTGSTWTVTGHATAGPLAGARLEPVLHHDTFAFAWFAFRPETTLYSE